MDDLVLLLNKSKMNVTEEVVDIIPGRALGVHAVGQYMQSLNIFLCHILPGH